MFDGVEAGPCAFRDSDLSVTLSSVEVRGAVAGALALSPDQLATAWQGLLGAPKPVAVVCDIRDRVAALYLRRGVLASVVIPEQRINDGELVLDVVEARIASVGYHGDAGPAQKQVARYLDQLIGMAPFDLDKAQRYLLLASDIPGVQVQATLKPAPQDGPGAVALDIAVSHDAVDGFVSAQNHGSKTIGRGLALARVDLNSVTSLGERTSVVGYWTLFSDEQRVLQVTEHVKLGGSGLAFNISGSWASTRPGDAAKPLQLEGESFAGAASLSYPLVRHRRQNLNLTVGLDWVDQQVEFGGGLATLTEDHLRIFYTRLDGHWAPRALQDRHGAITGSIEVRRGSTGLGASDYGKVTASRYRGRPDALVWRAQAQAGARLFGPVLATAELDWQHTDAPLLSYEEFSAGNLSVGRGYDPSAASGDRAVAASLELTTVPLPLIKGGPLRWRPYVFYDATRLTNIGPGAGKLNLTSAGAGVRVQLSPRVSADIGWAKPFDSPNGPGGGKPADRVLISLSASLF